MNIQPTQDRVLVRPQKSEDKTPGGIVIPDNAKPKPTRGEVIAVGPGKYNDRGLRQSLPFFVRDTVLYGKYGGTDVEVNGETPVILTESEIIATVHE